MINCPARTVNNPVHHVYGNLILNSSTLPYREAYPPKSVFYTLEN